MDTNLAIIEDTGDVIAAHMRHQAEEKFQKLLPLAEQGDAEAQYQVGKLYVDCRPGIPLNDEREWHWNFEAAKNNHPLAMASILLAQVTSPHKYPDERPWKDEATAVQTVIEKLERMATKSDNTDAMEYLGFFSLMGIGCERNFSAAIQHLHSGAKLGCHECMAALGITALTTQTPIDDSQFSEMEWMEKSWSEYNLLAGVHLGQMHLLKGDEGKDKAIEYFLAAANLGSGDAAYHLANCYSDGTGVTRSEETSFRWYLTAAERNNDKALYELARIDHYLPSIDVQPNQQNAWMEQAASLGEPKAMAEFGYMLLSGSNVERDVARGADMIKRGAKSGNAVSLHMLGRLYRDGEYVLQDYEAAAEYFRRSAADDLPRGHLSYGYALLWGDGVEKDALLASEHFSEAFDAGIFDGAIGLGVADYQLSHGPIRALGFILFGVREIGGTPPNWVTEFIEELTEQVGEAGMALVEEFYAHLLRRFNN